MTSYDGFYTMKGYSLLSDGELTSAMEDYLEMIARIENRGESVRVIDLSRLLHVKASSVTKMVQQLAASDFVQTHKYGAVELSDKGRAVGEYLLYRHEVLRKFLCLLNHSENELEQAEKIEHYLDERTIKNLEKLNGLLQNEWSIEEKD